MRESPANKPQMRVLYCILDNRFGGPHRLALTVAHHLREQDVETIFLFGHKTDEVWQPEGFESFLYRRIQCFTRHRPLRNFAGFCAFLPYNLLKMGRLMKSRDIRIVHIDGVTNFVPALAARLAGIPIVWRYNDHLPGVLKRLLLPLVARLASTVIVQGERLRQSRTEGYPRLRDKTTVLYSAVDTREFVPEAYDATQRRRTRLELGVPADGTLIGTIGNLNRFKGHAYFLEAAAALKQQLGPVKFLVVGRKLDTDPGYWEFLQQLTTRLDLTADVVYAGFRDDTPAVLAALDMFVLPSILESCPLVLLEAMAMQVPVVATAVGAVPELVLHEQTGLVVPAADSAALARAVLTYLAKPKEQVRNMVAAARKRVEETFAADIIARQQLEIYEGLNRRRVGCT